MKCKHLLTTHETELIHRNFNLSKLSSLISGAGSLCVAPERHSWPSAAELGPVRQTGTDFVHS